MSQRHSLECKQNRKPTWVSGRDATRGCHHGSQRCRIGAGSGDDPEPVRTEELEKGSRVGWKGKEVKGKEWKGSGGQKARKGV